MVMLFEKTVWWYSLLQDFSYVILCPNLMTVKFSEDKVKKHISKELITRIIKLEYEKLLLLKSPQNIVIYCDI